MAVYLGVDTLCWHLRLEAGDLSLEGVLEEAAAIGCDCVQVNLHHACDARACRARGALGERAGARTPGARLGRLPWRRRETGDAPTSEPGACTAGSSGRPRSEARSSASSRASTAPSSSGRPDLIEARAALRDRRARPHRPPRRVAHGITLLLENHSDFTAAEYESIVDDVGPDADRRLPRPDRTRSPRSTTRSRWSSASRRSRAPAT